MCDCTYHVKSSLHLSDAPKSSSGSPGEPGWGLSPSALTAHPEGLWAGQAESATRSQNPHQKLKMFTEEIPNTLAIPFELYHGK